MRFIILIAIGALVVATSTLASSSSSASSPRTLLIPLRFGIRPANLDQLNSLYESVSSPTSPQYGAFLTYHELAPLITNHHGIQQTERYLKEKLNAQDIVLSADGAWLDCRAEIVRVEEELQTKVRIVKHQIGKKNQQRNYYRALLSTQHTIPRELKQHVDVIIQSSVPRGSTTTVETAAPQASSSANAATKGRHHRKLTSATTFPTLLTIADLNSQYNITSNTIVNTLSPIGSVFEISWVNISFLHKYELVGSFNPEDLENFLEQQNLLQNTVAEYEGTPTSFGCFGYKGFTCTEANLDVEMMMGIAQGLNLSYWTEPVYPTPTGNPVLQYLTDMLAQAAESDSGQPPAWVNSISYGPKESDLLQNGVAQRLELEFQKLSVMGATFITSSGDDGVAGQDARHHGLALCNLVPQYPATSTYVTTVGGSFGPEFGAEERACQVGLEGMLAAITSGGGFSNIYAQPEYQKQAVAEYIATASQLGTLPPPSMFASQNRAYPDISLQSNSILTYSNGAPSVGAGTSASAPIFAGMISLIVDARISAGLKSPGLGALNPLLYSLAQTAPQVYTDLTVGENNCTGNNGSLSLFTCCPYGFPATIGWDAMTGLGVVNFGELKEQVIMQMQQAREKRDEE